MYRVPLLFSLALLFAAAAVPPAGLTAAAAAAAEAPSGLIAYVRDFKEVRVIQADGSNDRRLWTHPEATKELGVGGTAWRPDGRELAFASGHAAATSLYHSDLYAIRPDGTGLRRLTNPPDPSQFGRFKKGTVVVPLRNNQVSFRQAEASAGVFIVYVAGAPEAQRVVLPVGTAKTLTFTHVADFGKTAQAVVAIYGKYRWFIPGVDVQAGQTTKAPELSIQGDGLELLGAFRPVWRSDGSRISYRNGLCIISSVPANPRDGEHVFEPMFSGKNPLGTCVWDWGPTPALANQVLYAENGSGDSSIWQITQGGTHPGKKLARFTELPYQLLLDLHWLPDGSGFMYANKTLFDDAANLFRYDFASGKTTQVSHFEKEFARNFSISPDGQWVVFERGQSSDDDTPSDLWVMRMDGSGLRELVKNGHRPSWSRAAPQP